jgi:vacuolar-type H+-ATPase subunit I/STV1
MKASFTSSAKPPKSEMLSLPVLMCIILAILVCGKIIWDAEWFQKLCFPAAYWTRQVDISSTEVQRDKDAIRDMELYIEAKKRTKDIDVRRAMLADKVTLEKAISMYENDLSESFHTLQVLKDIQTQDVEQLQRVVKSAAASGTKSYNSSF